MTPEEHISTVVVEHELNGVQLSEGFVKYSDERGYFGKLPGLSPAIGDTPEEVRKGLERVARSYYGDEISVEFAVELELV